MLNMSKGQERNPDPAACSRALRRPRADVNYQEDNAELDDMLGFDPSAKATSSTLNRPNVHLWRRKLEHTCKAQGLAPSFCLRPDAVGTAVRTTGFRHPIVVRANAAGSVEETRTALGLHLPVHQLTPSGLIDVVGADMDVPTFDVATQGSGPTITVAELAAYHLTPAAQRNRLINVVSFNLADTPLVESIVPPKAVRDLDLVAQVWPKDEYPRPETLLYALVGPQGAYTDWHVDFGGSSVWYHILQGCKVSFRLGESRLFESSWLCPVQKVFMVAPSTPHNIAAFKAWSSSVSQATEFLGDKLERCIRITLRAGDTLFLPSGWPHAVSTPQDSFVIGGNYLHPLDYSSIAMVYQQEIDLGIKPKFQYPLFKQLLWYAARNSLRRLRRAGPTGLSSWEYEGLPALLGVLRSWHESSSSSNAGARRRSGAGMPSNITDAGLLLDELERCLEGHDDATNSAVLAENGDGRAGAALKPFPDLDYDANDDDDDEYHLSFEKSAPPQTTPRQQREEEEEPDGMAQREPSQRVPTLRSKQHEILAELQAARKRAPTHTAHKHESKANAVVVDLVSSSTSAFSGDEESENDDGGNGEYNYAAPLHGNNVEARAIPMHTSGDEGRDEPPRKEGSRRTRATKIERAYGSNRVPVSAGAGMKRKRLAIPDPQLLRRKPAKSEATLTATKAPQQPSHRGFIALNNRAADNATAVLPARAKLPSGSRRLGSHSLPAATIDPEKAAALRLVREIQRLEEVIQREERLLKAARSGEVALKDGGAKLAERLDAERAAVQQLRNRAEGRVLWVRPASLQAPEVESRSNGCSDVRHGPYSAQEIKAMRISGTLGDVQSIHDGSNGPSLPNMLIEHEDGRPLTLQEAEALPERLAAPLLRQSEPSTGTDGATGGISKPAGGAMVDSERLAGVHRGEVDTSLCSLEPKRTFVEARGHTTAGLERSRETAGAYTQAGRRSRNKRDEYGDRRSRRDHERDHQHVLKHTPKKSRKLNFGRTLPATDHRFAASNALRDDDHDDHAHSKKSASNTFASRMPFPHGHEHHHRSARSTHAHHAPSAPSAWAAFHEATTAMQEEDDMLAVWSFKHPITGQHLGPYTVGELRAIFHKGELPAELLCHDEDGGISRPLYAVLGYSALAGLNVGSSRAASAPPDPSFQIHQPNRDGGGGGDGEAHHGGAAHQREPHDAVPQHARMHSFSTHDTHPPRHDDAGNATEVNGLRVASGGGHVHPVGADRDESQWSPKTHQLEEDRVVAAEVVPPPPPPLPPSNSCAGILEPQHHQSQVQARPPQPSPMVPSAAAAAAPAPQDPLYSAPYDPYAHNRRLSHSHGSHIVTADRQRSQTHPRSVQTGWSMREQMRATLNPKPTPHMHLAPPRPMFSAIAPPPSGYSVPMKSHFRDSDPRYWTGNCEVSVEHYSMDQHQPPRPMSRVVEGAVHDQAAQRAVADQQWPVLSQSHPQTHYRPGDSSRWV